MICCLCFPLVYMLMYHLEFEDERLLYVCLWFKIVHPYSLCNLYHVATSITQWCLHATCLQITFH